MVIRASSSQQVDALLTDLAADAPLRRDSAVARLTVIGSRAVQRLIALAANVQKPPVARAAAFRALEGIADPRGLQPALVALGDLDAGVSIAAIGTARALLLTPHGVDALDRLASLALDRKRSAAVRLSAIHALSDLDASTLEPLFTTLRQDPDPEIAAIAAPGVARNIRGPIERLADAAAGNLSIEPESLRRAIAAASAEIAPSMLHKLVEHIRVREGSEPAARRAEWMAARAAAHLALARRNSRVALYDLRETIEAARQPLPVEFLAAVTTIGDVSCLESLVTAFARTSSRRQPADEWWRRHLAEAFHDIVRREKMTRQHAEIKKIEKRWKEAMNELWSPLKL